MLCRRRYFASLYAAHSVAISFTGLFFDALLAAAPSSSCALLKKIKMLSIFRNNWNLKTKTNTHSHTHTHAQLKFITRARATYHHVIIITQAETFNFTHSKLQCSLSTLFLTHLPCRRVNKNERTEWISGWIIIIMNVTCIKNLNERAPIETTKGTTPSVSVIVVIYNGVPYTELSITSLCSALMFLWLNGMRLFHCVLSCSSSSCGLSFVRSFIRSSAQIT